MNPKKEFVNAIMSVLRLEQNIYVTASIEEIVDRIDMSDYTIFIAYLGERNSDFERPIQTIAKATEDFYEKKNMPKRIEISEYAENICKIINGGYHALVNNKKTAYLQEHGKERFSTTTEHESVILTKNKEIVDFISRVKSIDRINVKENIGIIDKVGGLKLLVDISRDDETDLKNYIMTKLGIEKYRQLSIEEKIDKSAKEGMNSKMLGLVNGALYPSLYY